MADEKESKLEQLARDCLSWATGIEVERILAAHWRVAQEGAPYTELAALVDIEDFTRAYKAIREDKQIIAAVLDIAVQIGYRVQGTHEPQGEVLTIEQQVRRDIEGMLSELYEELDTAVETGIYEEVKLYADSLLGFADLTLRPNPELNDLLENTFRKIQESYKAYVKTAEVKEKKAIDDELVELADKYQQDLESAQKEITTLGKILKHLQYKRGTPE